MRPATGARCRPLPLLPAPAHTGQAARCAFKIVLIVNSLRQWFVLPLKDLKSTQGLRQPMWVARATPEKRKEHPNLRILPFPKKWQDAVWTLRYAGGAGHHLKKGYI